MPREVKAYACEFRCGRKVTTKKEEVIRHEAKCLKNPANKTCKICLHDRFIPYEDDTGYGGGNDCDLDVDKNGMNLIWHCEKWTNATEGIPQHS